MDPAWDSPELAVKSDSRRTAKYRRHQSWYRETQLNVRPGPRPGSPGLLVGSMLDPAAVEADRSLNFIDAAAHGHAEQRSIDVQAEGGTLEAGRLFHNMLSSMPMCFNFVGSLGEQPSFVLLVRAVLDESAEVIVSAECETTPTHELGDRTAFDAYVRYEDDDGAQRFLGIETKYTEPFSPRSYDTELYRTLTDESGWFRPGASDRLVGGKTNQLWRGLLLTYLVESESGASGAHIVVTTADDDAAADAVAQVREDLSDPDRLRLVTLEAILEAAAGTGDATLACWAEAFRLRYLADPR